MVATRKKMTDAEVFALAVELSGWQERYVCERLLSRDRSVARKWRQGAAIPETVMANLRWFVGLTAKSRTVFLQLLEFDRRPTV